MEKTDFHNFTFLLKFIAKIFVVLICIMSVLWFIFPIISVANFIQIIIVLALVLCVFFILVVPSIWYYQGWNASRFKSNDSPTDEHIGVIIVVYKIQYFTKWFHVYLGGIELLINGLEKRKKKFVIYRCSTPNDFKKVVRQTQTNDLWIFSHGKRDRISFGNEELEYQELQDCPKKNHIVQLHCNHGEGRSLADYLCDDIRNRFVTDDFRSWHENRKDIQTLLTKFYD